jgi:signal transduction histidine kinase
MHDRRYDEDDVDDAYDDDDAARGPRTGLSAKLLVLTILFVMLSEVLIYVPSIANFRNNWLRDRHATASVAAAVVAEDEDLPDSLKVRLLQATNTEALSYHEGDIRRLLALDMPPSSVDRHVHLETQGPIASIMAAFDTLLAPDGRLIRITGMPPNRPEEVDVVLSETPLRKAMLTFSRNVLILSLIISVITATLVYMSLRWLLVRPIRRLTDAITYFADDPEDVQRIIEPSNRRDEIGEAEHSLADMQHQLSEMFHERRRLAELGLAVSKINHDLRNLLSSAQLFSDRLASLPDPTVQRFVPKVLNALDRAVSYTNTVINYGKAGEAPPSRRLVSLRRLVDDVGETLGLPYHPSIEFLNEVPPATELAADPDQIYRVLMNICRNAVQALESDPHEAVVRRLTVAAERAGGIVHIEIADTGPGIPPRVREHLFQPFRGSARAGGTGLGLAIAAELVRAHGGSIALADSRSGTTFLIDIPDRPVDFAAARRAIGRAAG